MAEKKIRTFRIDPSEDRALEAEAARSEVDVSTYIRDALRDTRAVDGALRELERREERRSANDEEEAT